MKTNQIIWDYELKSFHCTVCGEKHKVKLPIEVDNFSTENDAFVKLHERCINHGN
jgi:hypothetical protein